MAGSVARSFGYLILNIFIIIYFNFSIFAVFAFGDGLQLRIWGCDFTGNHGPLKGCLPSAAE